jgi:hypothetical protein
MFKRVNKVAGQEGAKSNIGYQQSLMNDTFKKLIRPNLTSLQTQRPKIFEDCQLQPQLSDKFSPLPITKVHPATAQGIEKKQFSHFNENGAIARSKKSSFSLLSRKSSKEDK